MRKHKAEHTVVPAQRRRRRLIWGAGGAVAAAVTGAAVAFALLSLTAEIDGGGNIDAPADVNITAANVFSETDVDCQVSVADGTMTLNMADGVQGGECDVVMTLQRVGKSMPAVKVADIDFATPVTETFPNSGAGCGVTITTEGTTVRARFALTGEPGVFTALPTAGITATDGSTIDCPSG